jgi:putative ABC transport system ATP-binding protein
MESVIAIRSVSHYFGTGALRRQILFDVSADLLPGEIILLTGPSGSGKTTILTLVGALRSVMEGSIRTLNQELNGAGSEVRRRVRENIGFIFQGHNLLESLTARQNVQTAIETDRSLSKRELRQRCLDMLASVGLSDRADSYPRELSGGQKQRVAIARALVGRPKVILADEPTAALDRQSGRDVVDLLHHIAKRQSCAILLVTHDNRILDIADRILTLDDGKMESFTSGLIANAGNLLSAFAQLQSKGDLSTQVSGLSDQQFIHFLGQVTSEFEQFLRTMDLANQKATETVLGQVLEVVTVKIRDLLNADRATVYLIDEEKHEIWSKIAHHTGSEPLAIRIPLGTGIAGYTAKTGETLNIADAYASPKFYPDVDRETGYRTHSIFCAPLYNRRKELFAVCQFINKKDGGPFTESDERRFKEFAAPLGIILESCCRLAR